MNSETIRKSFQNQKVLIIGDVMIDSYIWGKVHRISPEAPVPIVNVSKREYRLGGAANVALNIQSLGAEPILCSVIGNDKYGQTFLNLMKEHNLTQEGIMKSNDRASTIKHRIMSGSQHILRVDQEEDHLISEGETEQLITNIKNLILERNIDVVIFEDYDKGVIGEKLISEIVRICKSHEIPTVVDPKKRNFMSYRHVSLFKPNLKELKEGLKKDINPLVISEVEDGVSELIKLLHIESAFITLSEHGVFIKNALLHHYIKAHKREITDVSGAGDTVVAVAALCMGAKFDIKILAEISNLAGGIVCEKIGVVPIQVDELLVEAKENGLIAN